MKPASVINQGENFVTLRATTDRPAEIREALTARDVQHVFKGDQNQAWDAVLANHCLARAVGDSDAEITFFIQDERLGTSDTRLARHWRKLGRRYILTEDYYRGRAGAVWEHQDTSYGLFFTEAVSPEQYASASVHLHRAAALWEKHHAAALADKGWLKALAALGVTFPHLPGSADAATRLGEVVDRDALCEGMAEHPAAAFYYAFTKTDGLYGLVPVENDNMNLSSIPAGDPEVRAEGTRLLVRVAAAGALRMASTAAQRRGVKNRARRMAQWADDFLKENPDASIADVQDAFGRWLTGEIFPADRLELDRTSRFTRVAPDMLPDLRDPKQTFHFFLDLSLRYPQEFSDAYNDALNRVGFGLQRMKYDARTGRYRPPFFVEYAPGGPGTPVFRYGIELSGARATTVTLSNPTAGDLVLESDRVVRSALDFARVLLENLPHAEDLAVVGKAATLAAELQRTPRGLGLPRQGSKYAPMVDHLVSGLRARGVLDQPTGLLIRIGLNTLDRLEAMGDLTLRLPRFLEDVFGKTATAREVARTWRRAAAEAHELLELLSHCQVGQHVHLARALSLNARGADWNEALAADPRLSALAESLCAVPGGLYRLKELGRDLPGTAADCIDRLSARRAELLECRRNLFAAARAATARGRVQADPERLAEIEREREQVECQLLLLFAAYVRRLWQRAESLPYLNDRPYTLALYLLFGRDIFGPICRNVEFDVEYVSPVTVPFAPCEPSSCA